MIGDSLFIDVDDTPIEQLPDDCDWCHERGEFGLIKTPIGKWLCFDCYDKALRQLRAKKLAALREHEKNIRAVYEWVTERSENHVEAPKECR